jgi:hypothetical protein
MITSHRTRNISFIARALPPVNLDDFSSKAVKIGRKCGVTKALG